MLAAALENFGRLELGTTDDLIAMLASGSVAELKLLCQGTAAARYFEPGSERMLASILGTLAPAIGNLRFITAQDGEPFSMTRGGYTSRSTSMQIKRTVEKVALASEITQLLNREGFPKRATAPEWRRIRFAYVAYPKRVAAFESAECAKQRILPLME